MNKTFLVMKQELRTTFKRSSYLFFAFGLPILAVLILVVVQLVQGRSSDNSGSGQITETGYQLETEGFVDHSGLIQTITDDLKGIILPFQTEALAKQALNDGEISAYFLIPSDYLDTGKVDYYYPDNRSYLSDGQQWVIKWLLTLNLLDGDIELADQIWNPIWNYSARIITPKFEGATTSGEDCSRPGIACESVELIRMMPSILVAVLFLTFMNSSSMLFNSVSTEKENRTTELLLLSINPKQLLAGKIIALGLAGISQTAMWLTAIFISFNLGGSTLSLPEGFKFPINIVIGSLFFFLGGFALYASLMAGAGALVPKMKEAGIANFFAMIPLFFGYVFGIMAPLANATGSAFLVFLSFFPLTSPVVMVMRLTDGFTPTWQLLVSIILLFITAYYSIQMVSAMFHAQNLLSGQAFSVKRYLKALTGRSD